MKNLLSSLQKVAALIFVLILSDSLFSQNVISSVNVSNNASLIVESITNNNSNSIDLKKNSSNWMSNKNYLDHSSAGLSYKIMMALNERVFENEKKIEDWMLENSKWNISGSQEVYKELKPIENWMLDESFWIIEDEVDNSSIENWMIDSKFWVMIN